MRKPGFGTFPKYPVPERTARLPPAKTASCKVDMEISPLRKATGNSACLQRFRIAFRCSVSSLSTSGYGKNLGTNTMGFGHTSKNHRFVLSTERVTGSVSVMKEVCRCKVSVLKVLRLKQSTKLLIYVQPLCN